MFCHSLGSILPYEKGKIIVPIKNLYIGQEATLWTKHGKADRLHG